MSIPETDELQSAVEPCLERRAHQRQSHRRRATLVIPAVNPSRGIYRFEAWTTEISLSDFNFVCGYELKAKTLLIQFEQPGEAAEVEVVKSHKVAEGLWEYEAVLKVD